MEKNKAIIEDAYKEYKAMLLFYVSNLINDADEAPDIVQNIFVRLMSYDIITSDTIKSLCFKIAKNLVIDYVRRNNKRQRIYADVQVSELKNKSITPENEAIFHDLAEKERSIMLNMSPATARVYEMSQIKCMTIDEIAQTLHISRRTVESHQLKGRKIVREIIRAII